MCFKGGKGGGRKDRYITGIYNFVVNHSWLLIRDKKTCLDQDAAWHRTQADSTTYTCMNYMVRVGTMTLDIFCADVCAQISF